MVCNFQKNKSKCKENRQTCNRYVDRSSRQLYNCNDYRSKEGSALGKNIVDSKILSRILRRNKFWNNTTATTTELIPESIPTPNARIAKCTSVRSVSA